MRSRNILPLAAFLLNLALVLPATAGDDPSIDTVVGGIPDGEPATEVSLKPVGMDFDGEGNLYIADPGNGIVWKRTVDGRIHHLAGIGVTCIPHFVRCVEQGGDAAETAFFRSLAGLAVGPDGSVYVSEMHGNVVKRIDPDTGRAATFAGSGDEGYDEEHEGGPATEASLNGPQALDLDSQGNLYIADTWNRRIRKVSPDGIITTVAGCGGYSWPYCVWAADGSPVEGTTIATNAGTNGNGFGMAVGPDDRLYIADAAQILRLDPDSQSYRVVAGKAFEYASFPGEGEDGPASDARFGVTVQMRFAPDGDLYLMEGGGTYDSPWSRLQKVEAPVGPGSTVRHVGGVGTGSGFSGDGGPARQARFDFGQPLGHWTGQGLAISSTGLVAVSDVGNERVRAIDAQGRVTTIAGNGFSGPADLARNYNLMWGANRDEGLHARGGLSGDGKDSSLAQLYFPVDVEADRFGNLFVLEYGNRRVRKIAPDGTITTVAGSGCVGVRCSPYQLPAAPGDGGLATKADFYQPIAITLDRTGTQLYIADAGKGRVRQVNLGNSTFIAYPLSERPVEIKPGHIQTVVGGGTVPADAPASQVRLYAPTGVATDASGALYVSDEWNGIVSRVEPATGLTTIVAGVPQGSDCAGDSTDGPGRTVFLCGPGDLEVAGSSLYVTETAYSGLLETGDIANGFGAASRIRRVDLSQATYPTTTVAGTGVLGSGGDGGPATQAQLAVPHGVAVGPDGSVYIGDSGNHRVRRIAPNGTISTIAGNGAYNDQLNHEGCAFGGDGGAAIDSSLCNPMGLDIGPDGTLYLADAANNRIRAIRGL